MKNVIDMSNLQNKPIYSATLDVEKAYDSVPFKAISVSLRRLKVPEIIIKLIESLNSDRDLTIKTFHGERYTLLQPEVFLKDQSSAPFYGQYIMTVSYAIFKKILKE